MSCTANGFPTSSGGKKILWRSPQLLTMQENAEFGQRDLWEKKVPQSLKRVASSFLSFPPARQYEHYRGRNTEMLACLLCFLFPPTKNKKQKKTKTFCILYLSLSHIASQVSDPFNISCSRFYNTFCLFFFLLLL